MSCLAAVLTLCSALAPDAPTREAAGPVRLALAPFSAAAAAVGAQEPSGLLEARKLAEQLRFEEAVVEYQRYLGDPTRPAPERARALFELAFIHSVLGDAVSAEARALEGLGLDPGFSLPASRPAKEHAFLDAVRKKAATRARLEVVAAEAGDAPGRVRARLVDPQRLVKRVLVRHALAASGPYYAAPLRCEGEACAGLLPPPKDTDSFTAYYYLEGLDAEGNTVASAASPAEPLQLTVVGGSSWYDNPWIWGIGAAAVVAGAGLVYALSPSPP